MSKALGRFREQQKLADQLVNICESDIDGDHDALSRAGVVFCVASWQAYVVNVIIEAHEEIKLKMRSLNADEVIFFADDYCELNETILKDRIKYFNTPNSENVTKLFKTTLAFDPKKYWNPQEMINDETMLGGSSVQAIMNFWLDVRHSIAHGSNLPKDRRRGPEKDFSFGHESLVKCVGFFTFLATQTDVGLNSYLAKKFDINLTRTVYVDTQMTRQKP